MKRQLFTAISALLIAIFIAGCAQTGDNIDYSKLSENETKLLAIQDEVNARIVELNAELAKNPPDYDQIRFMASETSKLINQSITRAENLAGEIEKAGVVEDTKKVLTSAQLLVNKVKELASELQILNRDIAQLAEDAKTDLQNQIDESTKLLEGYKSRLAGIDKRFAEIRALLFGEEPAPKEQPAAAREATI